ncbi:MAG: LamG domain-containing protein [bacterium]|nr:LamG domain-containing protein [bacterium]
MKHIILMLILASAIMFTGCTVNNYTILPTQPDNNTTGTESFTMAMSLKTAIDSGYTITRVTVKIANGTFTDSMDLTISGDSAKGTFTELVPGTYTITVKAYQNTMLVAQGTGSGVVVAGEMNQAYIHLQFVTTTGDLEIIVDWGTGDEPLSGLVASYPFTGNANDASGNGHNGVVVGATLTSDRFGNTNSAYLFNGTSNIITLCPANQLSLYDQDFTVSAWFNGSSFVNRDATILGNDYGTVNSQLAFMIRYNKPLMDFVYNWTYGKSSIQTNTWYHIVFRYKKSSGEQGIFINGLQDTLSLGHSAFVGTDTVRIGRWNRGSSSVGPTYFMGTLDDIQIYNRALTDIEIQTLYHENGWN